jgi:2-succinyl-6-hydroxy-2,4-cyclohexadiene-1-carboxylate synthase
MKLIFALHGFLGNSSDWDQVLQDMPADTQIITPNLFEKSEALNIDNLLPLISKKIDSKQFKKKIFIGYSLGGRIGLQILNMHPELFDHYIFVSTHPGLTHEDDKQQRLKNDLQWKQKISNEDWSSFLSQWNSQDVFKETKIENRREENFEKKLLVMALDEFSLGRQDNFENLIKSNQHRITWVVGIKDSKFLHLAHDLERKKTLFNLKRVFSGHRILFDNPLELKTIFLQQVL